MSAKCELRYGIAAHPSLGGPMLANLHVMATGSPLTHQEVHMIHVFSGGLLTVATAAVLAG